MKSKQKLLYVTLISTLVLMFCIDRLTKAWALESLQGTRVLIPNVLHLALLQNTNIIFWLRWPEWIIMAIVGCVMVGVIVAIIQAVQKKMHWLASALALILFGAFSNFLDRVQLHAVTDFIAVPFWSVFNLADVYIVCGVVAIAAMIHFDKTPKKASL